MATTAGGRGGPRPRSTGSSNSHTCWKLFPQRQHCCLSNFNNTYSSTLGIFNQRNKLFLAAVFCSLSLRVSTILQGVKLFPEGPIRLPKQLCQDRTGATSHSLAFRRTRQGPTRGRLRVYSLTARYCPRASFSPASPPLGQEAGGDAPRRWGAGWTDEPRKTSSPSNFQSMLGAF